MKRMEPFSSSSDVMSKKYKSNDSKIISKTLDCSAAQIENYIKHEGTLRALQKKGIQSFFPIQYKTFDAIYSKKDMLARDKTGSGKTLAFVLPVLERLQDDGIFKENSKSRLCKFLIVLPTRQLTLQVKSEIDSFKNSYKDSFKVCLAYGGTDMKQQMRDIQSGVDIIVSTPGRLVDFLNRGVINLKQLKTLCFDEADEMLKQGFKEEVQKILQYATENFKKIQILLFSATIPDWVHQLSDKHQSSEKQYIDLIKNSNQINNTPITIDHFKIGCQKYLREKTINEIIKFYTNSDSQKILIFSQTKRQANQVANQFKLIGKVAALHGDIPQFKRQQIFKRFKNGEIRCVVATNLASRGLDFPQISLVIQVQPPKNTQDYIHRAGRTGRAGRKGTCITLYTDFQQSRLEKIQRQAKIPIKKLPMLKNLKESKYD